MSFAHKRFGTRTRSLVHMLMLKIVLPMYTKRPYHAAAGEPHSHILYIPWTRSSAYPPKDATSSRIYRHSEFVTNRATHSWESARALRALDTLSSLAGILDDQLAACIDERNANTQRGGASHRPLGQQRSSNLTRIPSWTPHSAYQAF